MSFPIALHRSCHYCADTHFQVVFSWLSQLLTKPRLVEIVATWIFGTITSLSVPQWISTKELMNIVGQTRNSSPSLRTKDVLRQRRCMGNTPGIYRDLRQLYSSSIFPDVLSWFSMSDTDTINIYPRYIVSGARWRRHTCQPSWTYRRDISL